MDRRTLSLLVLPLTALFALTACTPGGSGSGGSGGSASEEPVDDTGGSSDLGPVLTECVDGDWSADLDDLAAQLGANLAANGLNVTSSTASGTQDVAIGGEGVLGFANAMTFVMTIDMGGGLVMTVTQTHTGTTGADWAWDGEAPASDTNGRMVFSNFQNTDYDVQTVVSINGTASEQTIPMPEQPAGDIPLAVTCTGDTMTTKADASPFSTTWHRV